MRIIFYYKKSISYSKDPSINFALECVEFELPVWTGSKGQIRLFEGHTSDTIKIPHAHGKVTLVSTLLQFRR